jgi:hypothetical protein
MNALILDQLETKQKRKRIIEGTLVASSNKHKTILSKRLIVRVTYYALNYKIKSSHIAGIRTTYLQ